MLLQRNATVTICHSKTRDLPAVCREAELLLVAIGKVEERWPARHQAPDRAGLGDDRVWRFDAQGWPLSRTGPRGLTLQFPEPPKGRLPSWHYSYTQQNHFSVVHPSFGSKLGAWYLTSSSHGVAMIPIGACLKRKLFLADYADSIATLPTRKLIYLFDERLAPGETGVVVAVERQCLRLRPSQERTGRGQHPEHDSGDRGVDAGLERAEPHPDSEHDVRGDVPHLQPAQEHDGEQQGARARQPTFAARGGVVNEFVVPRAGETVSLHVQVRHFRGATETLTIPVEIPAHARGRLSLMVSDGQALAEVGDRGLPVLRGPSERVQEHHCGAATGVGVAERVPDGRPVGRLQRYRARVLGVELHEAAVNAVGEIDPTHLNTPCGGGRPSRSRAPTLPSPACPATPRCRRPC